MKLKDIEKSLKNEQGQIGVPDVLARAKKAPINRLLEGQTPLKAFNKSFASRLLWCATLLLVSVILCVAVYALLPKKSGTVCYGYVSIRIENADCIERYGLVVKDDASIALVVKENGNESDLPKIVAVASEDINYAIKEFYTAKQGDKVSICVFFDKTEYTRALVESVSVALDSCLLEIGVQNGVSVKNADNNAKVELVEFIGGGVGSTQSIGEIVDAYYVKFMGA